MAIQPIFTKAIFDGNKLFEYRRVYTKIRTNDKILIYESCSDNSIVGEFIVGRVLKGTLLDFECLEKNIGIKKSVANYLKDAKRASALEIISPIRWKVPIKLKDVFPNLMPPQSYLFINSQNGYFNF